MKWKTKKYILSGKRPVFGQLRLGQVRSQFSKKSTKTTFVERACPFDSVLFSGHCRHFKFNHHHRYLPIFSLVYSYLFSCAIKPGAFSDCLKRCEFTTSKENLSTRISRSSILHFIYISVFAYTFWWCLLLWYEIPQILIVLLVNVSSLTNSRFNVWIIIPEKEEMHCS